MKKLTIFVLLAIVALTGRTQDLFDLGPKVGLNTSKISANVDDYNPQTINNYLVGAFARINLGRLYVQPEAYYNSKGGEYIDKVDLNTVNSFNMKTVDVPALVESFQCSDYGWTSILVRNRQKC